MTYFFSVILQILSYYIFSDIVKLLRHDTIDMTYFLQWDTLTHVVNINHKKMQFIGMI